MMRRINKTTLLAIAITAALLSGSFAALCADVALADPAELAWSIIDTPAAGPPNNTILSPSEVNAYVIATDDTTLYAVDIPNRRVFKSSDGGTTWPVQQQLEARLTEAGANLPAWNIAVAPDDPNFVVAVTDGAVAPNPPNGPKEVFISSNGGTSWDRVMSGLIINPAEFISSVDISVDYGGKRDIAIGTRDGTGSGKVWVVKAGIVVPTWIDQGFTGDVVAMKFSPTYTSDFSLATVYSNVSGTYVNVGIRDTSTNTTNWTIIYGGTPPEITTAGPGTSPKSGEIITADLELPSDFSGQDINLRRLYVCTDAVAVAVPQTGVYRIDNTQPYHINPPTTGRISSIAYYGTYAEGKLVAGEVNTAALQAMVKIWRCTDPILSTPTWQKSDEQKSPTGGANSTYANAQVDWSTDGARAYCGTSSASFLVGGTALAAGQWPQALLTGVALDESAFSVSPYSQLYEKDLLRAEKTLETDVGKIWNQVSLIDTEISLLSDVAALDIPQDSTDYPVRYLATINNNVPVPGDQSFDSVWRRTGDDKLLQQWERILCVATVYDASILRVNPRVDDAARSRSLVFASHLTTDVRYSSDEGQSWHLLYPAIAVTDLTLASDTSMYVLSGTYVRRGKTTGTNWIWDAQKDTTLNSGHTIATPLKNPEKKTVKGEYEDWVAVGSGDGYVAYADFSKHDVEFQPSPMQRVQVTIPGNTHVIFDDKFDENGIIYAATNDTVAGTSGKIYRWTVGKSTAWDELEPPNNAFYGICHGSDVLYGVWNEPAIPGTLPGVDRTLYSRSTIPPPIGWDDLTEGLPLPPNTVLFIREPSALKISTNDYNNLWAIDNRPYTSANSTGCLWAYTDTMARKGPWSTAPASGDLIPVDPVSGRATEVNFAWDSLESANGYELQIAKDNGFDIQIFSSDNITPVDQTAPAVYFPAGGLSPTPASAVGNWGNLESGHDYYWRVRAGRAVTGEIIHSPWSATMYFTVKIGVPTTARHLGLTVLKPSNGAKDVSLTPSFSWAPFPKTTDYEIIIARDPALSDYIVKTTVSGTAYEYDDILDPNKVYFWQVRAIKPVLSDPSPVATFTTTATADKLQEEAPKKIKLPFWIWPVIGVYAILTIVMIVFVTIRPAYFGPPPKRTGEPQPFVEKPKTASEPRPPIEKPGSSLSEKLKGPFERIAEAISPRIRRRHYLDELEERGIIKPEPEPIEEIPRESFWARLKNALLARFRKRQHPEDEGNFD